MNTALAEPTESASTPASSEERSSVQLAMELLGGARVLQSQVVTDEDAHDLVLRGIPAAAMARLFAGVLTLSTDVVLAAIGVSERSLARRKISRSSVPGSKSGVRVMV